MADVELFRSEATGKVWAANPGSPAHARMSRQGSGFRVVEPDPGPAAAPEPEPEPEPESVDDVSQAEVRDWAREHGIPVNDRGRVPDDLKRQYLDSL